MKQLRLITDASVYGYGFRLDGKERQWELGRNSKAAAREWRKDDPEATEQVWRELLAVERAVDEVGKELRGHSVLVCTDASAVVRYINWGTGSSKMMTTIMRDDADDNDDDDDDDDDDFVALRAKSETGYAGKPNQKVGVRARTGTGAG